MARSRQRSLPSSLPAPVGGWNARDSIAAMNPADAVSMVNMFPRTTDVILRDGYSDHVTGITGQVESLMAYNGAGTSEMYAIAVDSVYNVTAAGAVGAAVLGSLANARWQYINIATAGGNFLEMCNGADGVHTNLHKNRVWFVQKDTLTAWYLPTQSISGAAKSLDLRSYCPHGGFLMAIDTWTIDAGYGVDDLLVCVTSEGDVAVFRGTDPASATTWAIVGVWFIGSPVGRRCLVKYGGDLLIITQDGLQSMSAALQSSRTDPRASLTDKILSEMSTAVLNSGANYGWETTHFPKVDMLVLNVPVNEGNLQQQYAMNTITGSWCNFQGWEANTFCLFNDLLYFGGNKLVAKAWDTQKDSGSDIAAETQQAFSYFDSPGQMKRFTMMRPTFQLNGSVSVQGNINVDFDITSPVSGISTAPFLGGLWDTATFDNTLWSDDLSLSRVWQGTTGFGYSGGPRLKVVGDGKKLRWLSTEVVYEPGGIL